MAQDNMTPFERNLHLMNESSKTWAQPYKNMNALYSGLFAAAEKRRAAEQVAKNNEEVIRYNNNKLELEAKTAEQLAKDSAERSKKDQDNANRWLNMATTMMIENQKLLAALAARGGNGGNNPPPEQPNASGSIVQPEQELVNINMAVGTDVPGEDKAWQGAATGAGAAVGMTAGLLGGPPGVWSGAALGGAVGQGVGWLGEWALDNSGEQEDRLKQFNETLKKASLDINNIVNEQPDKSGRFKSTVTIQTKDNQGRDIYMNLPSSMIGNGKNMQIYFESFKNALKKDPKLLRYVANQAMTTEDMNADAFEVAVGDNLKDYFGGWENVPDDVLKASLDFNDVRNIKDAVLIEQMAREANEQAKQESTVMKDPFNSALFKYLMKRHYIENVDAVANTLRTQWNPFGEYGSHKWTSYTRGSASTMRELINRKDSSLKYASHRIKNFLDRR